MRPTDFEAFAEIVAGFAELKGRQLSPAAIKLFWNAMQPWSLEDFRAAANRLLLSCEFMPTPRDFERLREAGRPTAAEAWDRVLEHSKAAYRDGSGLDDDGPIDRAVRGLGGYRAIAFHDVDYLPLLQRQFVERYAEQTDAAATRAAVPQIAASGAGHRIRHDGPRKLGELMQQRGGESPALVAPHEASDR